MEMSSLVRVALVCSLALGANGCFLPTPFTEPASPLIVGHYRQRDGAPAVGARVAVTDDARDATCSKARALVATDSAGAFRLPATTVRRRGVFLVPAFERFANAYWLCASAADSVLHMAYSGWVSLGERPAALDSLACLEWAWQDEARVTCWEPEDSRTVQMDGRWEDAGGAGFFRLIVVEITPDARKPGVFLQWVEPSTDGTSERVRETVALPLAPKPLEIEAATLRLTRAGATCVRVSSTGEAPHWWSAQQAREDAAFVLGAPGQMRRVRSCAREGAMH